MVRFDAFTTVNSVVNSRSSRSSVSEPEPEGKGVNSLRKEGSFLRKEASLSVPQVLHRLCKVTLAL